MIETGLARLRLAGSVAFGASVSARSVERIVEGAHATLREYGAITSGDAEPVGAAAIDQDTLRRIGEQGLRKQAVRAARETRYYAELFERSGCDPAALSINDLGELPLTSKQALRDEPAAFVCRGSKPFLSTPTTGTTGRPAYVFYSQKELETFASMAALHALASRQIWPDDVVQVSISLRAALATTIAAAACARVGAVGYLSGQLEPAVTLRLLSERRSLPGKRPQTSVLLCYASYLGELIEQGHLLGYSSRDFGLRSIRVGGEMVTEGLKERARAFFGSRIEFVQGYATTELDPLNGSECSEGHLHFQPSAGLVEVKSLQGARPAGPGEPGTIVATPFAPFRETTLLVRYDTEDVVRALPSTPSCSLRNLPGISKPLGRLPLSVQHDEGWTFQREVIEALDRSEAVPLPARYSFWRVSDGVAVEVLTRSLEPSVKSSLAAALEGHGVPLRELHLVDDPRRLRQPLPVRADLRDGSFEGGVARSSQVRGAA